MKSRKSIFGSIGWGKGIFLLGFGVFMLFAGNDGYHAHKVHESEKYAPLEKLEGKIENGDLLKIGKFYADFKYRVRGLYDKTKSRDLSMLIPLRVPGEEQTDKIKYLYLLPDDIDDPIQILFKEFKSEYLDMQPVSELVVEVSTVDELPGDVPEAVRKNEKVSKDVVIFWHKADDPAWGVFVFFGSLFMLVFIFLYIRHSIKLKRAEETF